MNIPQFVAVLEAVVRKNVDLARAGRPVKDYLVPMAWGDPGLGKTDVVEAVAEGLGGLGRDVFGGADDADGWGVIHADLHTRDPADLGGMPWVEGGVSIRCRPDWLPTGGRGLLFLDELPQAGIANMNVAATLVRERRVGEHGLPPGWMVVCAGNHPHNRAGTTALPGQLRNRLVHLRVDADANAWAAWAAGRGVHPVLIAYNRYRASEYHHRFSATDNAYPTPRAWATSDAVLALDLPLELRRECHAGTVGDAAAADFEGFREIYLTLPDVDAILRDPDAAPVPEGAMTLHALVGALAHRATRRNFASVLRYLGRLPEQDFALACVVDATARDASLASTPAYQAWAVAHGDLLSG